MTESECLRRMIAPGQARPGKWRNGIVQIWVTRLCNLNCYGCTQGGNLAILDYSVLPYITPEQFRVACESMKGYFGVIGLLGGNPCRHPQFPELCRIMRETLPKDQCGLWSNNLMGHGEECRKTFNPKYSNLNVHLDRQAYEEIQRTWPEARPFGLKTDSRHGPPFVALQDLVPEEDIRWELISTCDINHHWSAMIGVFRGELRAWFCEIAASQSMLHQHEPDYPDTGLRVEPDWWRKPMEDFAHQVRFHCHRCGVPLRGMGTPSQAPDAVEQVTQAHISIYHPKRLERRVQVVTKLDDLGGFSARFTDYIVHGHAR